MTERYIEFKKELLKTKLSDARINSQHTKNKLTAEERINLLADKDTFVELNAFTTHRSNNFDLPNKRIYRDGIITGCCRIKGKLVFVAFQDFTAIGGSMGEMQAQKLCNVLEKALETGAPFIQINDSGGARIQEGIMALEGYNKIFKLNTLASGVIPQISAILGPCAGGASYSPAITDFVFMVKDISKMFITGPNVIKQVTGEDVTLEELGGAMTHNQISGNAHFYYETERECFNSIRELIYLLPSNNTELAPGPDNYRDIAARPAPELNNIVPDDPKKTFDMKTIIKAVVDDNYFYEVHSLYAPNAIVGFARLNKRTVGIVANQPKFSAGSIDINSSDKIARFVRFCDCFNIPIINFVDVPGYLPGVSQEYGGIIRHGAKVLFAYAEATIPKIAVIVRKAFGGAYIALASPSLGYDRVICWPNAEIAVMGAEAAVEIIYAKELNSSEERDKFKKQKVEEYKKLFSNPLNAAALNIVDMIIEPQYTRIELINAIEMLITKKQFRPYKKHGNIPL